MGNFRGLTPRPRDIVLATINFLERRLRDDDLNRTWFADFLDFVKRERVFADFLTPPELGGPHARWDSFRNTCLNEVLAFDGLCYWYTWQGSILGLGPLWMSPNQTMRKRAAQAPAEGGILAFGL